MNPDHAHFAEWDAAYVIGALSSAERRQFEEHLADCPACRRAIGELSPTVGLLSRVSAEQAHAIDAALAEPPAEDGGPGAAVRSEVVSLALRRARRRRRAWWLASAAAAVVLVAAIALPFALTSTAPTTSFALESLTDVPLEATVRLDAVGWGTRIDLECRYTAGDGSDAPAEGWPYALSVVGLDGVATDVSTWRARPGTTAHLSAGTALDLEQIEAIEIRSTASGRVLMRYELADAAAS